VSISDVLARLTARIETASRLDPAAGKLHTAGDVALASPAARDALAGRAIGHPLHPILVQLTGGSLMSATALDLIGGSKARPAARRLIGLGLLSAVPSALAGLSDWLDTEGAERRVGVVHAGTNTVALGAYLVSFASRSRGHRGRPSAAIGIAALCVGGWLGGHLSFGLGVGVDTTAFQTGPTDWEDVAAVEEVTDELRQVVADGVALVLSRIDGEVVALADRCTHRGGPLSDGERDGDCVICPWHGSRFSLRTGDVKQGPAVRPQPVYETRERNGRIEVRRTEARALRRNPVGT